MTPSRLDQVSQIHSLALSRRALVRSVAAGGAAMLGHSSLGDRRAAAQNATPVGSLGPGGAELLWDTWGVPHIFADDDVGLFYAFGWAQMHSHGDLILRLYAQGRGRMAEYWGEEHVEIDRATRLLGIPALGAEWTEAQSPAFRANLDAFVAGMNAYARQHPAAIGEEFVVAL